MSVEVKLGAEANAGPPDPDPDNPQWLMWAAVDDDDMPIVIIQHRANRYIMPAAQARELGIQWMRVADMSEGEAAMRRLIARGDSDPAYVQEACNMLAEIRHDIMVTQAVKCGLIPPGPDTDDSDYIEERP